MGLSIMPTTQDLRNEAAQCSSANKIIVRGGKPLITRWFGKNGVRCTRDMWIPGYVPWT